MSKNIKANIIMGVLAFGILGIGYINNKYEKQWERMEIIAQQSVNYEIVDSGITKVEKTEETTHGMSDFEQSDEFGKRNIYRIDVTVKNIGEKEFVIGYELLSFHCRDKDGYFVRFEKSDYYWENDNEDLYLRNDVIPPGETGTISFYASMKEESLPEEFRVYTDFDNGEGEEPYFVINNINIE